MLILEFALADGCTVARLRLYDLMARISAADSVLSRSVLRGHKLAPSGRLLIGTALLISFLVVCV